jgi:3',5'-cyclic AMP phosphodiesterase CpdA
MIIAQISDTHIQAQAPSARSRLEDLARTVASINALRPRPAAVLHTGDVAHDATAADYAAARAALSQLACPVYATVGNRDRRDTFRDAFAEEGYLEHDSSFVQFAVNLGAARIVAVDTLAAEGNLGGFCTEREVELRRLLGAHQGQPTLVFMHHPPVAVADVPGSPLQFSNPGRAGALASCLTQCSSVIGVVAGHVHCARTAALGGVALSTVPSIAADLSKERVSGRHVSRPIYHLHTIDGTRVASASILV